MTREEAIKIIKKCKEKGFKYTFYTVDEYHAALDIAIKALRREDTFLDRVLEIIDGLEQENIGRDGSYEYESACKDFRATVEALKEGE